MNVNSDLASPAAARLRPVPEPNMQQGMLALQAMAQHKHPLAALEVFHREIGDIFRARVASFDATVLVGPEAARFVLVQARHDFRWRNEGDPVVDLLRHGVLVEDGAAHDHLRALMTPSLHRRMLDRYVDTMIRCTDTVLAGWQHGSTVDMLVEMRKVALLILMQTLYGVDYAPHMQPLWQAVLDNIGYISPGLWMVWRGLPRPRYRRGLAALDTYLHALIAERRAAGAGGDDMLSALIQAGLDDDLIRDQLLTMLIAGHDTSTAHLSWTLLLLGQHPDYLATVQTEVDDSLGRALPTPKPLHSMALLGRVLNESLRLYPPIHLGARVANCDLEFDGFHIPAGARVVYSIYLTHRDPAHWPDPQRFDPERFATRPAPYTFIPFGGGPRNCIGAMFGQVEARVVIARILQQYTLELQPRAVHPHMGATLEPHPGVFMTVRKRS